MKGYGYRETKTKKLRAYFGRTPAQCQWYINHYEKHKKGFFEIVEVELNLASQMT